MSAHCGWRMPRACHTTTCAPARHRSECEFYLEHFVVQLYLCCLYFVYLYISVFYLCHLHIPGSFYIYIYQSQSEVCLALNISGMVFLFYLSVLPLTVLFCNLYFIKCRFINMIYHADLCLFSTLLHACLACL